MSIIKKTAIDGIKKSMQSLKTKNKRLNKEINTIIENQTSSEKKNLENALKQYNQKMDRVLNSSQVKSKMNEKYDCEDQIMDLMTKVKSSYRKAIRAIKNQPISDEEKRKRIINLGDALEDAVLSNDEKKIMKAIKDQVKNLPYQMLRISY